MPIRSTPSSASVARPEDGKLYAPAAERNTGALCALLDDVAPARGTALEIASGTGQHIVAFARRFPDLHWQPSEPDPLRRDSIRAYASEAAVANIADPIHLDATTPGWSQNIPSQDLVVLANLLHLISAPEAEILIAEAAQTLGSEGLLMIYGPFMREGALTSASDRDFHHALQQHDSDIGYKDAAVICRWMQAAGLQVQFVDMPANNLAILGKNTAS